MSKKSKSRQPHHPAHPAEVDPDELEQEMEEEETETMPDDEPTQNPASVPKHPDPEGKMVSYAPGFTVGPDGGSKELPKEEKKDE